MFEREIVTQTEALQHEQLESFLNLHLSFQAM